MVITAEFHDQGNATNHKKIHCNKEYCGLDPVAPVDKTGKSTKVPMWQGVFAYFCRALLAIASISKFGSVKHNEGKFPTAWKKYPETTYADALGRHLMAEGKDGLYDPESGMLHAAHAAWNALARLELLLESNPLEQPAKTFVQEAKDQVAKVLFVERRKALTARRIKYPSWDAPTRRENGVDRRNTA